jgi:D-apiose dehydrogenase
MADDLKGVLVGAGFFAGFQAEAWRRIAGVRLAAVADIALERAQAFAAKWGIPRAYGDAAEMLEIERPDFVDIATRPDSHRSLADLAAGRGAHVICQKPLAPTWDEAVAMARGCAARGVRLFAHENWRWQPWYRACKRIVDEGTLGRPFYFGFRLRTGDGHGPEPYAVQPYFREMPQLFIYEAGVHFLDTFRYLGGEIDRVFCRLARINPVIRGEDAALVHLAFASGADGLIDGNRLSGPVPAPPAFGETTIEGERASLRVGLDARVFLKEHGKDERPVDFPTTDQGYRGDSVRAVQEHIIACLRSGRPAECEAADYLKTTAAVFACYRSAETGQPVAPANFLNDLGRP